MLNPIQNRYEILYWLDCTLSNPNGDPDADNMPRIDPQDMHGLISDVAVKRRIRNYVQAAYCNEAPNGIVMQQGTNINRFIAQAHAETSAGNIKKGDTKKTHAARRWLLDNFFDVRTFGGVLSTGPNAGQVRGAVQMTFLRSEDSIVPLDMSITRVLKTQDLETANSVNDYIKWEDEQEQDTLRTMGRKQLIPYGLYQGRAFISANVAADTGFSEDDLQLFLDALIGAYELDRSSSKGQISTVLPVIIFKHVGTDSDEKQRLRQAKLGCAPAHKLFDLIAAQRLVDLPRKFRDYQFIVNASACPPGVEIGYVLEDCGRAEVHWSTPPACDWLEVK